jgi:hypothetical protein
MGGIKCLKPKFTIFCLGKTENEDISLPSVSTCFHYIKIPEYSSEKKMRERLLFSIKNGDSFHLT